MLPSLTVWGGPASAIGNWLVAPVLGGGSALSIGSTDTIGAQRVCSILSKILAEIVGTSVVPHQLLLASNVMFDAFQK